MLLSKQIFDDSRLTISVTEDAEGFALAKECLAGRFAAVEHLSPVPVRIPELVVRNEGIITPGQVNYAASKAALAAAVKSLAREVGRKGILVNAVAPGVIETDMTAKLPLDQILPMIPVRRMGRPEEIAGVVSFLCSEDSTYVHGQIIAANGGLIT